MKTDSQASIIANPKNDTVDIKDLIFRYLHYWPAMLIFMILGYVVASIYNKFGIPIYSVESSILIAEEKSPSDNLFEGAFGSGGSNLENEIGILKSYSLAEQTIDGMGINVSYFSKDFWKMSQLYGNLPIYVEAKWDKEQIVGGLFKLEVLDENSFELLVEEEGFQVYNPKDPFYKTWMGALNLPKSVFSFGEPIKGEFFNFTVNKVSINPGEVIYFSLMDTPSLALNYKNQLQARSYNSKASILAISLNTPVRRLGEDYVNRLTETYITQELKDKNRTAENTIKFIEQQLSGISDSLQLSENKLETYRSENQIFDLSAKGDMIFENLQELEKEKIQIELNIKYYKSIKDYLANNRVEDLILPSMSSQVDPLLNALIANLSELQTEKIRLTSNFSDETPRVKDINFRILNSIQTLKNNVNSTIANNEDLIADLNSRIRSIETEVNSLPETEKNLLGFERQFSLNEDLYIYLLEIKAEAQITKAGNMPKNSVLDYAKTSGQIAPNPSRNLTYGLIIGLMIPLGFIFLKDFLNVNIEDPKELEQQLKVPLVGILGRNSGEDKIPVLTSPKSTNAESFRSLRADINFLSEQKEKLTLLFTSSTSGEGKTFISINMAAVYALMGKKTILIGLDLRKPKIAEDFNMVNDKGLSSCLSSNMSWKDVVKPSGFEGLDVILSGPIPPNPAELLLQDKFGKIIKEIKENYDIVVFDCPPVGLVSETKQLFAFADINFFVFRQGFSNKGNTQVLNNLVEKGGVSKIYGILNDVHLEKKYGYGYGYSYGYGYGYGNNYSYHQDEKKTSWWKRLLKKRA
jgi:tyrosine-protein kinase Etk/Wzc